MLYEPLANLLSVTEVQCIFFMYCWLPLWRKNSLYFKFNLNFLVHKGYLKNDNVGSFALFHKEFRFVKETRQIYSRFSHGRLITWVKTKNIIVLPSIPTVTAVTKSGMKCDKYTFSLFQKNHHECSLGILKECVKPMIHGSTFVAQHLLNERGTC